MEDRVVITNANDLRRLSDERVAPRPVFAVAPAVLARVGSWPLRLEARDDALHSVVNACGVCGQGVAVAWNDRGAYRIGEEALGGLVYAHLVQAHGWTRQTWTEPA